MEKGLTENLSLVIENLFELSLVIIVAVIINLIAKNGLVNIIRKFIRSSKTRLDDVLIEHKVFAKVAHLAPALVFYFALPFIFPNYSEIIVLVQRFIMAYMILVVTFFADAVLSALLVIYESREVSASRPIKGQIQAFKLVVYLISGIFILSVLLNRTPWGLISVLGGLTAIVILVFKDPILGFVASIQLISNNMVSRGDWIEMSKYAADGDVIDVSLTTVKVQNWDKTITTIPTYALVSDSFKNWKGMEKSGGRRIKRPIYIDMNSIKFCDEADLKSFEKIQLLQGYLKQKRDEVGKHNKETGADTSTLVNGRHLTNVGTFRAYIAAYLRSHAKINQELTFLIRHLSPGEHGLPIEIYVFTNDTKWANYESIQADIFDHILAVAPEFGLRIFQQPTGSDFSSLLKR